MTTLPEPIATLRARPEILRDRAAFYVLRDLCEAVRREHGVGAAMGWSAELYESIRGSGDTDLRMAMLNMQEIIEGTMPDSEIADLNGIIPHDRDDEFSGRPRWHLENPWFHIWYRAKADTSNVRAHWSENSAVTQTRDLAYAQGLLQSFTETPNPGRDELAALIAEFTAAHGRPPRLLDIGCGVGNWIVWAVQHCGVQPMDCYGIDQLAGRIVAAQALGATVGIPPNNFITTKLELPDGLMPDIVILAAVTGCLQDAELTDLAYRIANCGSPHKTVGREGPPFYIFETHAIDSIGGWIGRANSDAFFEPVGYKPMRAKFTGDPITRETLASLVLVQKYFLAMRCAIYERAT